MYVNENALATILRQFDEVHDNRGIVSWRDPFATSGYIPILSCQFRKEQFRQFYQSDLSFVFARAGSSIELFDAFFDSHKYTLINDLGQDINTQETNHM